MAASFDVACEIITGYTVGTIATPKDSSESVSVGAYDGFVLSLMLLSDSGHAGQEMPEPID